MNLLVEKAALFARLAYEPHPGQQRVHRSRAQRRVLACGARWGKSTLGAMEAVAALLEPRPTLGWIVAPSYDLSERTFGLVERVVQERLAHRVVAVDRREHRIVLRNLAGTCSEVRAKSADRPAGLLGEGLDWLIVDEAARLPRRVWETALSQRLIDRRGWALLLSTPTGPGWFREMFKRGRGKDASFESWSGPSWDNPRLDRGLIEEERERLGQEAFDREYGGRFSGCEHEPCERCGGPDPLGPSVVVLHGDEELAACGECGRAVNEEGRTVVALWPEGVEHVRIIRLLGGPAIGDGDARADLLPPSRDERVGAALADAQAEFGSVPRVPVKRRPARD